MSELAKGTSEPNVLQPAKPTSSIGICHSGGGLGMLRGAEHVGKQPLCVRTRQAYPRPSESSAASLRDARDAPFGEGATRAEPTIAPSA